MHCGNGSSIRKPNSDSVDMIHVQLTRTEKVAVHEKYHVRMNHYEDHKIVLCYIKNIGYIQKGRERTSHKCIFFLLELREISLELNFEALQRDWRWYARYLQITSKFFSFLKTLGNFSSLAKFPCINLRRRFNSFKQNACRLSLSWMMFVTFAHRRTRRGSGGSASPCPEKFQGKLCFQGKLKLLKNPER